MHACKRFLKINTVKRAYCVLDQTTCTNSSQRLISKSFNDETSFLWVHYLIFTYANAFLPLSLCLWKNWESSHTFTSYTEFDLQHIQNNKKNIVLLIHIQVTWNNLYFKLFKYSKFVTLTGTCPSLFCNIHHNDYPESLISIKHIKHHPYCVSPRTRIFLSNRSINICILNSMHVNISELVTPLNTARKIGKRPKYFPVFFTKIKPNYASLKAKTSIASTYHQRLSSRRLFQGWYHIHIAPCNGKFPSLLDLYWGENTLKRRFICRKSQKVFKNQRWKDERWKEKT